MRRRYHVYWLTDPVYGFHHRNLSLRGNGILGNRKRDGPISYRAQDERPHIPRWNVLRHVAGRKLRRNGQLWNSRRYRRGGSTAGYLFLGINNGGAGWRRAQIIAHLFCYRINRRSNRSDLFATRRDRNLSSRDRDQSWINEESRMFSNTCRRSILQPIIRSWE